MFFCISSCRTGGGGGGGVIYNERGGGEVTRRDLLPAHETLKSVLKGVLCAKK